MPAAVEAQHVAAVCAAAHAPKRARLDVHAQARPAVLVERAERIAPDATAAQLQAFRGVVRQRVGQSLALEVPAPGREPARRVSARTHGGH
jgi:hypothetical protein